jgi:DNA-binding NarL/FixJ family response regulator
MVGRSATAWSLALRSLFNRRVAQASKVLLVVAHPVIASAIETLLRLEGDYDVKRVASIGDAANARDWGAQVALVDGTLLTGHAAVHLGTPAYVLSGNERDGRQLARKLDDPRGWLRKDATGPEFADAIRAALQANASSTSSLGTFAVAVIVVLCVVVLALVAYLVWLAVY